MTLSIKPAGSSRWDAVALGEVMLRLDPGESRIRTARSFTAWEGGGEYNLIRGLRKTFNLKTTVVTALVDNEIGRLLEDLILQGGVDTSFIKWSPFDGIGRAERNGLNFTERGFGVRAPLGISDRGHSATSKLKPGSIEWSELFKAQGARWFHTGGIFAALSESTAPLLIEGADAARSSGATVSFDFNYRASLWKTLEKNLDVQKTFEHIMEHTDVVLGSDSDFTRALGYQPPSSANTPESRFEAAGTWLMKKFSGIKLVTSLLRTESSQASGQCSLGARALGTAGLAVCEPIDNLATFDRVGSGDCFGSGLVYGLLSGRSLPEALRLGVAHAALTLTTPGDNSMMAAQEVEELARAGKLKLAR